MSEKQRIPWYQDVDGFRIPGVFSVEVFRSALAYKPRPDDLIIVTYPKCGTTWVQNIVSCIYREGETFNSAIEFCSSTPFLEMAGAKTVENMKRPGAIKSHLPFKLMPYSSEAKYIYIARNPKDCCVSFYHFTESTASYKYKGADFDEFFELFIEGQVDFGDYFETTLSWYEHRNDPNVLFITYEDLKRDTRSGVLRIAEFMGLQYKETLEKNEQMLQDVIHHSSFSFMKEHLNKKFTELASIPKELIRNNPDIPEGLRQVFGSDSAKVKKDSNGVTFIRKGTVGDWRNYFSPTQNSRLEKKFQDKMKDTDLCELWKHDM